MADYSARVSVSEHQLLLNEFIVRGWAPNPLEHTLNQICDDGYQQETFWESSLNPFFSKQSEVQEFTSSEVFVVGLKASVKATEGVSCLVNVLPKNGERLGHITVTLNNAKSDLLQNSVVPYGLKYFFPALPFEAFPGKEREISNRVSTIDRQILVAGWKKQVIKDSQIVDGTEKKNVNLLSYEQNLTDFDIVHKIEGEAKTTLRVWAEEGAAGPSVVEVEIKDYKNPLVGFSTKNKIVFQCLFTKKTAEAANAAPAP